MGGESVSGAAETMQHGPAGSGCSAKIPRSIPNRIRLYTRSMEAVDEVDQSELLRPYVPRLLIEWLLDDPHRRWRVVDGSLAFVDISGFTQLTERLARKGKVGAEELNDTIDGCFTELLSAAYEHGAGLVKWGGDAVLLLFDGDEHAPRAARAAAGMQRTMRAIGRLRTSAGPVRLRMSIGLHSGLFHFFLVGRSPPRARDRGPGCHGNRRDGDDRAGR